MEAGIIFYYTAIESFISLCIPEDYKFEKVNNKKVKELWNKESIERWISTSEKLVEVLPKIFNVTFPKSDIMWANFKEIERIRNEIIHQKTINNLEVFEQLLSEKIFYKLECIFDILEYYANADPHNLVLPHGFGVTSAKIIDEV